MNWRGCEFFIDLARVAKNLGQGPSYMRMSGWSIKR